MSSPVFLMIGRTMEQNLNCMESLIVPKNQECEVKTPGKKHTNQKWEKCLLMN